MRNEIQSHMIIDKIYLRKVLLIELNVLFDPSTERAKNAISPPSSKIVRIKVLRTSKASLFFAKTFLSQKYRQISRQSKGVPSANFAQTINKTFAKIPLRNLCHLQKNLFAMILNTQPLGE